MKMNLSTLWRPLSKTGRSVTVKLKYVKAPKWTSEHIIVDPKERNALTGPQWVRASGRAALVWLEKIQTHRFSYTLRATGHENTLVFELIAKNDKRIAVGHILPQGIVIREMTLIFVSLARLWELRRLFREFALRSKKYPGAYFSTARSPNSCCVRPKRVTQLS